MRKSNELQIGKAGEYMVCADLILKGLIAYPSEQGLPYDVVIDNGKKLLKCQVKTTLKPRIVLQRKKETSAYIFNIKRHGKYNDSIYGLTEVDLFALVCLDTRLVGYLKNDEMPSTINLRVDSMRGQYYDEQGIVNYQKVIDLSKEIKSQTEIAKKLNMHVSTVNRILKDDYKPFETTARYFSELHKNMEWFTNVF